MVHKYYGKCSMATRVRPRSAHRAMDGNEQTYILDGQVYDVDI